MREGSLRHHSDRSSTNGPSTQEIACVLFELAQQLSGQGNGQDEGPNPYRPSASGSIEQLVCLAEEELRRRRLRTRHFPRSYFAEGAWAILLDLFVSQHRGRKVSTIGACLASELPESTALRCLDALEKDEYVRREATEKDRRVKFVKLTARGYDAVHSVLKSYLRKR